MASYFEEKRFFLGEKSNHMVTVTPFMGKLKVHIRQFSVNEKGEKKPGKNGITLELEESEVLAKLVPKGQDSTATYELRDTGIPSSPFELDLPVLDLDTVFLPSPPSQEPIPIIPNEELWDTQPKFPSSPPSSLPDVQAPLVDPDLEKVLSDIRVGEQSNPTEMNFINNGKRKMINDCDHKCPKAVGFSYPGVVLHCSECESEKKKRKTFVKKECIDEVASVGTMKEVERKLWLTHYDMLNEKLNDVIREKCTGCQINKPNQLAHDLCLLASVEEQGNTCFGELYKRVIWDEVLDNWDKKGLEMPVNLNPETLIIFKESVNPKEFTYKNRLRKWLIESPTIEV